MADRSAPAHRVTSRDGTEIAYWTSGAGPPLLLVHGVSADHTRWRPLLPLLEPQTTVHALDRRGRGGSGDGPEYRLARECEDVASVVDAIAEEAGAPVDVYGHSFGGLVAFGAATLTGNVRRLVLYEGWPSAGDGAEPVPPDVEERIDALIAGGEREAALETVFRELAGASEEEVAALRAQPSWPARLAAVHTVMRELRATAAATLEPAHAARLRAPTLLITGEESTDPARADVNAVAAALPDARIAVLEGQGHLADVLVPELVADRMLAFLHDER